MPRTRLFYHFVWTTAGREPLLTSEVRPALFEAIRTKCEELGVRVLEVNAMSDHVHLVASVAPRLSLSEVIGQLKGVTSHRLKERGLLPDSFRWQGEYGVVSLTERHTARVRAYVRHQEARHAADALAPDLEPGA